jgi:hypothetical protein
VFIRLVVTIPNPRTHVLTGIFDVAYDLRDGTGLSADDWASVYLLLDWFEQRLPVPTRFSRSTRRRCPRAICWFKANAGECITRVNELGRLIGRLGLPTRALRTPRPGYVVYEDRYQVAAVPFRDTGA